ncbi:hypothetical protein [Azospirillum sp. sgz301742]
MAESDTPDDLTGPLSPQDELDRYAKRCDYFLKAFEHYNTKLKAHGLESAEMNKGLLAHAVESYFLDIQRLKTFHGLERANRFKRAGFSVKWLCRIRPIQVGPIGGLTREAQRRAIVVNADFALTNALVFTRASRTRIDRRLLHDILYSAHYRDVEGAVMAQLLEAFTQR